MNEKIQVGENFSIGDEIFHDQKMSTAERVDIFNRLGQQEVDRNRIFYHRLISSPSESHVFVEDPISGDTREMIMFGSNSYLGLGNHPHIREKAKKMIDLYGSGVGGVAFLSGYTKLHQELEERIAAFKGKEAAMVFSSGYSANVGLVSGMTQSSDIVIYDEYSHASFYDGMILSRVRLYKFRHNNTEHLEKLLKKHSQSGRNIFVGVEGVYSMDGDICPLDEVVRLCKQYNAMLMVDDAHGTGVLGASGRGVGEHYKATKDIDLLMGTFSKAISATGGFITGSKEMINFLRYFSRSYMFSSAMCPGTTGAILGALDVMENEPERRLTLLDNVQYAVSSINQLSHNFDVNAEAAIVIVMVPLDMDIRLAAYEFHKNGIFLNSVEYPAVPVEQQRFRISLMATHTKKDIDELVQVLDYVWNQYKKGMFSFETVAVLNSARNVAEVELENLN
ncbi:aminotransferase class I/II-fold pyridoxal phosphate-dependent enzyme [Teredinibacter waterburyi]|uniref:aminotransferase class I/II-fold pyridoxal phosphate-dependent enzyme n=1 Tax=Teredinibacter waterburyi TaxID=1500538 RepID=UPI00165FA42D|nr:pyridoxal phosphate-dependent aminotransferase family protein [Teredinibacter waterburyi]